MSSKELIKKTNNCVDAYSDSFGYSSFGEGGQRFGSISFFQHVTEWRADGSTETENVKYNVATLRMPEELMLKLADFIIGQHENAKVKEQP
ncbi:hypothetical protein [Leclercia sp.]|uniref:hypothetical protein n=1 Tax=Leclercia sp. TaxID=1898428 RepID=UPI0028B267CF|nr:hypothetical protein [Leclercia sp.]